MGAGRATVDASEGARETREDGMRRERGDGDDGRWW